MIKDPSKNQPKKSEFNKNLKIAIVRSNYHEDLTKSLENACKQYLTDAGVQNEGIKTFEVPGSWEIPLATQRVLLSKKF